MFWHGIVSCEFCVFVKNIYLQTEILLTCQQIKMFVQKRVEIAMYIVSDLFLEFFLYVRSPVIMVNLILKSLIFDPILSNKILLFTTNIYIPIFTIHRNPTHSKIKCLCF